jgi:hypothetical protein
MGDPAQGVPGGSIAKLSAVDAADGETLYVVQLANRLGTAVYARDGSVSTLVQRTGVIVTTPGGSKSISSLSLLDAVPSSSGHDRSHRGGEVAMRLGFTDKSNGVALATLNASTWTTTVTQVSGTPSGLAALGSPSGQLRWLLG